MARRLLVATGNSGKLREYAELLAPFSFALSRPADLRLDLDVAETGASYAENARLKAIAFSQASGLLALADDSGMEIAAFGGWPGIHSVRFAGPSADDATRRTVVLTRLGNRPEAERNATFVCAIAIADRGRVVAEGEGRLDGTIARAPRGGGGFGYDPIFVPRGATRTVAELSETEKNQLSHRARAVQALHHVLEAIARDAPASSDA